MEPASVQTRRRAIVHALSRRAGPDADSTAIAAAVSRLHDELVACLVPVIGQAGVAAMSGRSLHLAHRQFPWLVPPPSDGSPEFTLGDVRHTLEQQSAAAATEAAVALLDGFGHLLTTFIGAGLTTRLLRQAWPDLIPEATDEERER